VQPGWHGATSSRLLKSVEHLNQALPRDAVFAPDEHPDLGSLRQERRNVYMRSVEQVHFGFE
jgi:hypothetical protein